MDRFRAFVGPNTGLVVAVLYGVVSISITIFNKAVLSYYGFDNANFLALGQATLSLLFLRILHASGNVVLPSFSFKAASEAKWLMMSFVGMVVTGLAPLAFVNIPMYTVLRRLTTCVTLVGERVLLGRSVPGDEQWSVVVMVLSSVLAGWGDLEFSAIGYVLIFINCLFTAWYLIAIKQTQSLGSDTFALMYYNNIVGLPLFGLIALGTEARSIVNFQLWSSPGFLFCFVMSSAHAFLLNWLIFLCSTINSPLTTSVTGQLKNIVTTLLGLVMFGGAAVTLVGGCGLFLSTLASLWYGYIKYQQSQKARREKKLEQQGSANGGDMPRTGASDSSSATPFGARRKVEQV